MVTPLKLRIKRNIQYVYRSLRASGYAPVKIGDSRLYINNKSDILIEIKKEEDEYKLTINALTTGTKTQEDLATLIHKLETKCGAEPLQ
jgi:hypothetical protein